MEPCGTPAIIGYLLLRKLSINFSRGPDIPTDLIL